ncbi:DHA2 family lincomycin resistance protein-like MFS transporter [Microbacterium phyllosphaerae]|uniref:DHA2 family lincomycin resistance protein-like MFS transporter n=1 Tax=Microbacterium phyllosphaerae TaxID=124798 RepID=A0ABS4WPQ8_9MICO|nr:MDR family MFS transporter [Microbacterium phyllosphaerae]MBP2378187.1 DHA2 family lincomycin resistance protein-like MFS transporter [Microbacterium phyllosphaerae]MCS3441850.1 DHA2 family lincomycin resistance protein-like MFS transporter [Microbacterium phyllosphaerae]
MSAVDTGSITTPPAAPGGEIARSDMRVIWLLLVAAFVAILNETTMGIAIPHLNVDLGIPPELGQWLTSAFMLTMAVVIPTTGFILQRFTTRQVFIAAMISFSLGTLVALVAPGFAVLLVGRVIQAAGTGIMMPLLMTTIMNVVPPQSRGRMMGRVGLVISLAPAIGPTLAGAVLETLHWRALFAIILPIALVSLLIGAKWMTNLGETRKVPLDVLSIPLAALGFGGIVFGLSQFGGEGGSGETTGIVALVVGAVALALFVWRQLVLQRVDDALLDLRVFRSANFTFSVIIMTILALSMFGTLTLLPQYLQNVAGLNALESGLILLPGSVLMGLLGPIMGRVYDARGTRPLLIPGTILVSAALFYYSTVGEHTVWWVLIIVQAAMSVGLAMSFTPLFSASLGSLQRSLYSHGSAVLNTLQQVGGAAGVAVLTVTYSAILHAGEAEGLETAAAGAPGARMAFLIAAIISLAAVALSAFVTKPADDIAGGAHGGH